MTGGVARGLLAVAALLVGLLVGTLGAFLQASRAVVAGIPIPWGTVLVLVALVVLIRGAVELADSRWAGWALFAGWLGTTVLFASPMPWGALVISAGNRQMAYLIGGVILGAMAATVPSLARLRRPRA